MVRLAVESTDANHLARFSHAGRNGAAATGLRPGGQRPVSFRLRADVDRGPDGSYQPLADGRANQPRVQCAGSPRKLPFSGEGRCLATDLQLLADDPVEVEQEPRVQRAPAVEGLTARHPFFWSGYMLVDTGWTPPADKQPAAAKK